MSNSQRIELLADEPPATQAEVRRFNAEARPLAWQIAPTIPILAALIGLLISAARRFPTVQEPQAVLSWVNKVSEAVPVAAMAVLTARRFAAASPLPRLVTAACSCCNADCTAVTCAW